MHQFSSLIFFRYATAPHECMCEVALHQYQKPTRNELTLFHLGLLGQILTSFQKLILRCFTRRFRSHHSFPSCSIARNWNQNKNPDRFRLVMRKRWFLTKIQERGFKKSSNQKTKHITWKSALDFRGVDHVSFYVQSIMVSERRSKVDFRYFSGDDDVTYDRGLRTKIQNAHM